MTRAEATKWLYRIYRMLKRGRLSVIITRKLDDCFGMAVKTEHLSVMLLNPDKPWLTRGGFMSTIVHEAIHLVDMEIPEKEVARLEREIFKALSDRQLANLLKRIAHFVRKG